jgi:glycosyltransferase involved in cell wall biosynthesis
LGLQGASARFMDSNMNEEFKGSRPDVSVLMSCYNAAEFLEEAIESVLTQTFTNFELILVDDGSKDETWDIIHSFQARDDRIVPISKENTGLADSLNVGIAQASGQWIARLDADDLCEPTRLEEQFNFVLSHPEIVLLGTGFIEINEQGWSIKQHLYPTEHHKLVRHLEGLQGFFPHSSAFYRVDVARQAGGYNKRIRRAEDMLLWLELAQLGKIACLPTFLVKIRKHSSQISNDDNGRRQICDGRAALVCHFLRKMGVTDPSISKNEDEWSAFLNWVDTRVEESGVFERRKVWADARAEYFTAVNRLTASSRFVMRLLQSGHFNGLVWEKFFGSSLPRRLAREWVKRSCGK